MQKIASCSVSMAR